MKIRNGFVSNSSSSSFILISNRGKCDKSIEVLKKYIKEKKRWGETSLEIHLPIKCGEHEFGRQYGTYANLEDKLNLVTYFMLCEDFYGKDTWRKQSDMSDALKGAIIMALEKACGEGSYMSQAYIDIIYDYNTLMYDGEGKFKLELDHQSDVEDNRKMFESAEAMFNFLFNDESAIYNGSDEIYPTFEYEEGAEKYREIYGEYPWCTTKEDFEFEDKDILQLHENEFSPLDDIYYLRELMRGEPPLGRHDARHRKNIEKSWKPYLKRIKREGKKERLDEYITKTINEWFGDREEQE